MTDAILNSKISLAKAKGIEVVADAHIPVKLKSSEIDLCCIIGNLFDNAIEASVKLPPEQRVIRVYMDMKNTQLYISFTNFTAGKKMKKEGKLFRSTKGEGHGFGLVRIDAIVERLEGYISRNISIPAMTIVQFITSCDDEMDRDNEETADRARAEAALRQSGLWEKIETLPKGMDTYLRKGIFEDAIDLSGGETQKLLLARAIYKVGSLLVLDEPTAALDPIAENKLYLQYHTMVATQTRAASIAEKIIF